MKLDAFQGRRALFGLASALAFCTARAGAVLAQPLPPRRCRPRTRPIGRRQRSVERHLHQPRQPRLPGVERSAVDMGQYRRRLAAYPGVVTLSISRCRCPSTSAPAFGSTSRGRTAARGIRINATYTWLTWALGVAPSPGWSVGGSVQHAYSNDFALDGPTSFTLATSFRPRPTSAFRSSGTISTRRTRPMSSIDRNVDIALALRPTGRALVPDRSREIATSTASGQWIPRATLGIDVPYLGRVRGDVTTLRSHTARQGGCTRPPRGSRSAWAPPPSRAAASGAPASAEQTAPAFTWALRSRDIAAPASPRERTRSRSASTRPRARAAHVALLRQLWRLARDPRSQGGGAGAQGRAGRLARPRRGVRRRDPHAPRQRQESGLRPRGRAGPLALRVLAGRTESSSIPPAWSASRA